MDFRGKNKGITLVALVITVIIIIILATVTINMAFGDNGLITQAQRAKDMTANSIVAEQEGMNSVLSEYLNVMAEDSEIPLPDPAPDIPGGQEAVEQGAISFTNPTWASGQASVTISTNTSYTLQYQVVANEGASSDTDWQAVPAGGVIGNLNHNDIVYARLMQGSYYGEEASTTVKDETDPTIDSITPSNITYNSVTVTVTASDGQSGLATNGTYKYYLNDENTPRETNTTGSYTFTGLSAETGYTIKVVVTDKAGNEAEGTTTATTTMEPLPIEDKLKAGDYVYYTDGKGTRRTCVVLYDSSSSYGVEIITMENVEDVRLGSGDFTTSMNSYNNAISTLNSKASTYNNTTYSSRARCVGSVPNNINSQSGYYTFTNFTSSYSGKLRGEDTNYETDWNKMETLGIRDINEWYWLASHNVVSQPNYIIFYIWRCRQQWQFEQWQLLVRGA